MALPGHQDLISGQGLRLTRGPSIWWCGPDRLTGVAGSPLADEPAAAAHQERTQAALEQPLEVMVQAGRPLPPGELCVPRI